MSFPTPSTQPPHYVHEELRQKIDEEIASLEARLLALKIKRNTLSPIARLHPEIMQEIFVVSSAKGHDNIVEKTPLIIGWVCSSWRSLAHQTSALWCHINALNPNWIKKAVALSRNRPLHFRLFFKRGYKGDRTTLTSACLENLHRMSTLFISSEPKISAVFIGFSPLWVNPAPLLVELDLTSVSLPSKLFSGTCPALRNLRLTLCEFNWDSLPVHPGIQTFLIVEPITKASVKDIIQKIQVISPEVENILLVKAISMPVVPFPNDNPSHLRQELPKLKDFDLDEEPAQAMTSIFDHFVLSPQSNAKIKLWMLGGLNEYPNATRSFVSFRGHEPWPVSHLNITMERDFITISMMEMPLTRTTDIQIDDLDDNLSLTMEWPGGVSDIIPILDILSLPPIKSLSFSGDRLETHGAVAFDYFNSQGSVEYLDVTIFFIPAFTRMMNTQNQQMSELVGETNVRDFDDEMKAHCRTIVSFHHLIALRYFEDGDMFCLGHNYFTILAEWLRWRRLVGVALEMLVFMDMEIPDKDKVEGLFDGLVETKYHRVEEAPIPGTGFHP